MKKNLITLAALTCVSASAFADWKLLDDFEGGSLDDRWSASFSSAPANIENTMDILPDPTGAANNAFAVVAGEGGNNSFVLDFGDDAFVDDLADPKPATLFFRHLIPTVSTPDGDIMGTLDFTIGMMSSEAYGGENGVDASPSWGNYASIVRSAYGKIDIRDNGYKDTNPASPADHGVWYSFWMIHDIGLRSYQVWVQGGSDYPEQTLITQNYTIVNPDDGSETVAFGEDNAADFRVYDFWDLDWLHMRYSANISGSKGLHNAYIDDIYVDLAGANATCPIDDCGGDELEPAASKLINISTRGKVGDGNAVMIGGFAIVGTEALEVLIQGVGPELEGQGGLAAADVLADPAIQLVGDGVSEINDDWESAANSADVAQAQIDAGAFGLGAGSKSSAILVTLEPGIYTVLVGGNGGEGVALVEAYAVPE